MKTLSIISAALCALLLAGGSFAIYKLDSRLSAAETKLAESETRAKASEARLAAAESKSAALQTALQSSDLSSQLQGAAANAAAAHDALQQSVTSQVAELKTGITALQTGFVLEGSHIRALETALVEGRLIEMKPSPESGKPLPAWRHVAGVFGR